MGISGVFGTGIEMGKEGHGGQIPCHIGGQSGGQDGVVRHLHGQPQGDQLLRHLVSQHPLPRGGGHHPGGARFTIGGGIDGGVSQESVDNLHCCSPVSSDVYRAVTRSAAWSPYSESRLIQQQPSYAAITPWINEKK